MQRTTPAGTSRRPLLIVAALGVAAAVAALAVWLLFFAGEPPAQASIGGAAETLESAEPTSAATDSSAGAATAEPSVAATDSRPASSAAATTGGSSTGVDGTWTLDTSVGSFGDYSSAWAGFRVNEVLAQGIGSTTAIGRAPAVSGSLTLDGQTLTAASIEVDLTTITSDRPRRDDAIQRSLETSQYPTATFVLTMPVDLGTVPADGQTVTVTATGDLTIHGVTQSIEFPLQAQLVGDTIAVVGSAPIDFTRFGITMPSAPVVVSVEDHGTLELQLFFTRS
jgi:polyisoprenoid-binding protein YceI